MSSPATAETQQFSRLHQGTFTSTGGLTVRNSLVNTHGRRSWCHSSEVLTATEGAWEAEASLHQPRRIVSFYWIASSQRDHEVNQRLLQSQTRSFCRSTQVLMHFQMLPLFPLSEMMRGWGGVGEKSTDVLMPSCCSIRMRMWGPSNEGNDFENLNNVVQRRSCTDFPRFPHLGHVPPPHLFCLKNSLISVFIFKV